MKRFRVGVDIGGTFTDVVFLGDQGDVLTLKVASTPEDYSRAVLDGICDGIEKLRESAKSITEVGHAFTIATNAILEEKGAVTALITTRGFRDVLEFRRNRVPRLYDLYYEKPPPLVRRHLRFEVRERLNFRGEVLCPLEDSEIDTVIDSVLKAGVESVVVCLLHSYVNPAHERRIGDALRRRAPDLIVTLSSELLPVMKEYERTSTAVINGYVRPVVERYIGRLTQGLEKIGVEVPLRVMQSNGGLATPRMASERPAFCIESGPAAGVMAAFHLGRRLDLGNLITLDMGGTTAKATIIEDGEILRSQEYEVGAGLNVGHRLLKGAGHILKVPAIDLAEVGAGGGSIATVDESGSLRVGPHSSGAMPGPACYGRGGDQATVTDANVLLGYLNPLHLLGGAFPLHIEKARAAVARFVSEPLRLPEVEAAYGIHRVANSNMSRALKAVSSERGRDPRSFTMMAFGGGGPIHATGLAEMLGISRVVVPRHPGVFSAFGLLFSDVEHHLVRSYFKPLSELDLDQLNAILREMRNDAAAALRAERIDEKDQDILVQVDLKYEGQGSELSVWIPSNNVTRESLDEAVKAFEIEHDKTFGHVTDAPHQLANVRVIGRAIARVSRVPDRMKPVAAPKAERPRKRAAYFGAAAGWIDAPIFAREDFSGAVTSGPLLIEEYDSTTVVPPGWGASVDAHGNINLQQAK